MASMQFKNASYHIKWMWKGQRKTLVLHKVPESAALAKKQLIEGRLALHNAGLQPIPEGVDIVEYFRHDGQPQELLVSQKLSGTLPLHLLRERYLESHGDSVEANSLSTYRIHLNHVVDTLGRDFPMADLKTSDLQKHVNRRKTKASVTTIRKELATFRACYYWGQHHENLEKRPFPAKALSFPKEEAPMPFMTWAEIERRIASGGDPQALWDCLFLQSQEVEELLGFVKDNSTHTWLYPAFVLVAHTGCRRSEAIRAEKGDVDFVGGTILIREKKKAKGKLTTRRVPMSETLVEAMQDAIGTHPDCPWLLCQAKVARSRNKRAQPEAITRNVFHDQFKRVLRASRWKVIKGAHVLRHSFISNCVSKGVDQRMLDRWVGHTTDVRERYTHLIPNQEAGAIQSVFGTS